MMINETRQNSFNPYGNICRVLCFVGFMAWTGSLAAASWLESISLPSKESLGDDVSYAGDSRLTVLSIHPAQEKESSSLLNDIEDFEFTLIANGARVIRSKDTSQVKFKQLIENLRSQFRSNDALLVLAIGNYYLDSDQGSAIFTLADNIESSDGRPTLEGFDLLEVGEQLKSLGSTKIASVVYINRFGVHRKGVSSWLTGDEIDSENDSVKKSIGAAIAQYAANSPVIIAASRKGGSMPTDADPTLFNLLSNSLKQDILDFSTKKMFSAADKWKEIHELGIINYLTFGRDIEWSLFGTSNGTGVQQDYATMSQINQNYQEIEYQTTASSPSHVPTELEIESVLDFLGRNQKDYEALVSGWNNEGMIGTETAFQLYWLLTGAAEKILQDSSGNGRCAKWVVELSLLLEETRQSIVRFDPKSDKAELAGRKQFAHHAFDIQYHIAEDDDFCLGFK